MTKRRSKTHYVRVRVVFNKPCTQAKAVAAVRDCIWGEFYPSALSPDEPEEFRVKGVTVWKAIEPAAAPASHEPPYGEWCRDPKLCAGKGYCPRDPTCGD